ncbi:MAG: hypothetical protein WA285_12925 [Mycobacterium sp.]
MPGNCGPDGPAIWYPGAGEGVGSAPAVPGATAVAAVAAIRVFLTAFIDVT